MNLKYLTIFLALSILVLSVGAISAAEDIDNDVLEENTNNDVSNIDQSNVDEIKSIESEDTVVKASNENTNTQTTTTTSDTTKTVKKTTVSTPNTKFIFKRNSKLKITIKDKQTNKTIKNLKIAFKIKNGKKYKTYTLKTNSKGVATFSTKKLSLGFHKFTITSKNSNYKVNKKDSVFIGNLYYTTLKMGGAKKLKNGDEIRTFMQKKNQQSSKGVYTDIWYTGGNNPDKATPEPKYSQIYSAKFFFKNKKTGKIVTVTTYGKYFEYKGELYRDIPSTDLMTGYTPIKTKIGYLISK